MTVDRRLLLSPHRATARRRRREKAEVIMPGHLGDVARLTKAYHVKSMLRPSRRGWKFLKMP